MVISRIVRLAMVGSLGLLPAEANAQTIDQARAAFEEGRFLEAADLAESLETSAGYALATQSLAVYGHYVAQEEDRIGFLNRAMELGEAAVRADSTNPEAHYSPPMPLAAMPRVSVKFRRLAKAWLERSAVCSRPPWTTTPTSPRLMWAWGAGTPISPAPGPLPE